ncbi:hypothetical protein AB0I27_22900 [Streptomyces sp. NPDC050597]|uniref:hypothetical protein n=1 Tax=Streptomyces sp. NPDC050597 TaxID=3157212 RepID=UPI0034442828
MTDQPYTDADLRAVAARLHAGAARDADERIRPAVQRQWGADLDIDQIDEACDEVTSILDRTANTSEWAINLGADGLEPSSDVINLDNPHGPFVRLHFAFHPDMAEEARQRFVLGVREALIKATTPAV